MTIVDRQRLHFIGIGGRAMGGIAIALAQAGHRVTGSDEGMYEPMSGCLRSAGIQVHARYADDNVPTDVDVVIVGKRMRDDNPELSGALRRGLPLQSFPQFLRDRFLTRSRNAVVAGGVGKTTTTAMLAWILEQAGTRPDYLIGGIARNFASPARFDGAGITVLEGDEYASGVGDSQPKFLHYAPEVAIVTNVIADHPDLYQDDSSLLDAFCAFVRLLPSNGWLILPSGDETAARLAEHVGCGVVTTGLDHHADHEIANVSFTTEGCSFELDGATITLPLCGRMNIRNAAMAVVAASRFGVPPTRAAEALSTFRGVRHRQDAKEIGDCTMVIDKASHPQSMLELCLAMRQRYPDQRLVMVIQPRATGGRRWVYQRDLPAALAGFDKVILTGAYEHNPSRRTPWDDDPFSVEMLAEDARQLSGDVTIVPAFSDLPDVVGDEVHNGDVVLLSLREQFYAHIARIEAVLIERYAAA
jgi:UDP-N-acetylmuramate: L-alanyl-gamma-D-glutamyl-meso-diaminopimelate ligase